MDTETRKRILAEAESWLGTPFHHEARVKGVGVDCGNFVYAVYNAVFPGFPPLPKNYPEDWSLHESTPEYFLDYLKPHATEISNPKPGDLILWQFGRKFGHATIYTGGNEVIHSWGRTRHGKVRKDSIRFFNARNWKAFEINER